jgi:hypothetical protein
MKRATRNRIQLIRKINSYSVSELALLLKVHSRTVQGWIRSGMPVIDPDSSIFWIRGEDAILYLKAKAKARRQPLNSGEFYCRKCRRGVFSKPCQISFKMMGVLPNGTPSKFCAGGECVFCATNVNRFYGMEFVKGPGFELLYTHSDEGLIPPSDLCVNTDMKREVDSER